MNCDRVYKLNYLTSEYPCEVCWEDQRRHPNWGVERPPMQAATWNTDESGMGQWDRVGYRTWPHKEQT